MQSISLFQMITNKLVTYGTVVWLLLGYPNDNFHRDGLGNQMQIQDFTKGNPVS